MTSEELLALDARVGEIREELEERTRGLPRMTGAVLAALSELDVLREALEPLIARAAREERAELRALREKWEAAFPSLANDFEAPAVKARYDAVRIRNIFHVPFLPLPVPRVWEGDQA